MTISRREFLKISGAAGLLASVPGCSGALFRKEHLSARRAEFYVPSPKFYLNFDQDFSRVLFAKSLDAPVKGYPEKLRTHLSVWSDGSAPKAVRLPGLVHAACVDGARLRCVSADAEAGAILFNVHRASFELLAYARPPRGFRFGGHTASIPGTDAFAVTTNGDARGKFDRISIRDRATLKETANISSYGFEAHDIAASPDGKLAYVGHYGSYFGTGPYEGLVTFEWPKPEAYEKADKPTSHYKKSTYTNIYPASVTVVELASGKLLDRQSSVNNGPHCHFAVGTDGKIYLTHFPSLIENHADLKTNPIFGEGEHGPEQDQRFLPKSPRGFGTSIAFDEKAREVLAPSRWVETMNYFSEAKHEELRSFEMKPFVPAMQMSHGLTLHPDGLHYVVTGNNWVATFERGTHRFVPEKSFETQLFVHAHAAAGWA